MAEATPPQEPNKPNPDPTDPANPQAGAGAPVPATKRRRRGWWWKITLGVVVLLLALVLLAPTIASTSLVRHYVVGRINDNLNGTLAIEDWSIGWTGGIDARGIKLFDERKAEVASIAHVHTSLSLLDALRGRYHLGQTVVDEPNLEQLIIYPDGTNNLQNLAKQPSAAKGKPAAERSESAKPAAKRPDVSGEIHVSRLRALVHDQRTNETITVTPDSGMTLKIKSLAEPIENAVAIVLRAGSDGPTGTAKLNGTATLAGAGGVESADEKLELASLPLQAANLFLALAGQDVQLGGVANGAVAVTMDGPRQLAAGGQIVATSFSVKGKPLNGETYATGRVTIPVKITRSGPDAQTGRLRIEALGIETTDATADVSGEFSLDALLRALRGKAPGSDGKLSLTLSVPNFKSIADQLPRTLHLDPGVKIAAGRLYHETNLWLSSDKAVVETHTDLQDVSGTNRGRPVALSPIHQTADVTLLPSSIAKVPDLHDLAITLVSGFAEIKGGGKTLANLNLGGNVDLPKFRKEVGQFIDFGKLDLGGRAEFAITSSGDVSRPGTPITAGANVTVTDLKIAGIDGMGAIEQPIIALKADGKVQRDTKDRMTGADALGVTLRVGDQAAPVMDAILRDGQLVMPASGTETSVWELLRGGNVAVHMNLPKAYDLIDKLQKPAAPPAGIALADAPAADAPRPAASDAPSPRAAAHAAAAKEQAAATQPLPPLKVRDGAATIQFAIARDASAQKTEIRDGVVRVEKLDLQRGESRYAPGGNAIDLQFAGDLDARQAVRGVTVSKLDGALFGGTVKVAKPLAITKLDATPAADGTVELAGKIDDVVPLLETLQARPKGHGYPYHGAYTFTQALATQAGAITVNGSGSINDFRVDEPGKPDGGFSEKQVSLANNVVYDARQKNLTISALKLDMTGSDALHLSAGGAILGVGGRQELKDLKLTCGYDLAKLWPIVYAMLSPEQQKDLKDAKVAGKYEKVFAVSGSYPAGKPQAIRSLVVNGALAVDQFDAMGVTLAKLDLPLALADGILRTQYTDRPEAQRTAPPATLNGGKMDLGGVALDLTGPEPRITTPKDWKLLSNVTINPLLGDNLGKYVNPVFVNSKRAQGLLDVTVNYCDGVALGEAVKTPQSGSAKVALSLRDMDIANPLGSLIVDSLLKGVTGNLLKGVPSDMVENVLGAAGIGGGGGSGGGKGFGLGGRTQEAEVFDGEIRNAVFTLEAGQTTQDVTLELIEPASPSTPPAGRREAVAAAAAATQPMLLTFKGNIRLSDLKQDLDVTFPTPLLVKFIPNKGIAKAIHDAFPNGIPLALKGYTNKPEIDAAAFFKQAGEAKLGQLIGAAAERGSDKNKGADKDKNTNPLGGLLDQLGKKKKDKSKD